MNYIDRFNELDYFLQYTDKLMEEIEDEYIQQRYLGYITVNSVTAYELAIKDVFYRFSEQHTVLQSFVKSIYEKLNGRITLEDLKGRHLPRFGDSYKSTFEEKLEERQLCVLRERQKSIRTSYTNIIRWRNNFAHQGTFPQTTNYTEVKESYELGKEVIRCLDSVLV